MPIIVPSGSTARIATVTSIIKLALKDAGVIGGRETPSDDEMQDALDTLNQMLAMWRTESLSVYCQKQEFIAANGSASYTIGTDGDLDIERPVSVDAAFWRDGGNDYLMRPVHSFEDYQSIGVKSLQGVPSLFYYRPDYPQGLFYAWPIPSTGSLYLTLRQPMPAYATINDEIALPPEYEGAIRWNLASMLCATFGMPITPEIDKYARQTKRAIKINNTGIKTMRMPAAVMHASRYCVYSDE